MKKVDTNKICKVFNTLRIENQGIKFSPDEMLNLLKNSGIRAGIFRKMSKQNFFNVERDGTKKSYSFTENPIYEKKFEKIYSECRSSSLREEEAIQLLKSLGYKITKVVQLDVAKLESDYPEVFDKVAIFKEF